MSWAVGGMMAVYKPRGMRSVQMLEKLKRFVPRGVKVGHGGTLDAEAEGVLVVGIGKGTRQLGTMLKGNKSYYCHGVLGVETDTYDVAGKVVSEMPFEHVNREAFEKALDQFRGTIVQTPPVFSSIKINGKRARDHFVAGNEVTMKSREVVVHQLNCAAFDLPHFELEMHTGGGFYVRSLVVDLARSLGTCGHMTKLIRTQQGSFGLDDAVLLENLNEESIQNALK